MLVRRRGLEPLCLAAQAPQACASANFATSALGQPTKYTKNGEEHSWLIQPVRGNCMKRKNAVSTAGKRTKGVGRPGEGTTFWGYLQLNEWPTGFFRCAKARFAPLLRTFCCELMPICGGTERHR
jgi:hypothetical protein